MKNSASDSSLRLQINMGQTFCGCRDNGVLSLALEFSAISNFPSRSACNLTSALLSDFYFLGDNN